MATEPCDRFNRFVNSTDYKFATVETKDDVKALSVTGLACKNLVEIHDHYSVWGSTKQDSLVELASAIIDPYYEKMKQDAQRTSPVSWHKAWCGNWMNLSSVSRRVSDRSVALAASYSSVGFPFALKIGLVETVEIVAIKKCAQISLGILLLCVRVLHFVLFDLSMTRLLQKCRGLALLNIFLMVEMAVKPAAPRGDVEDNDNDEQVGVCEASPEPFQLFQRHKESLKSGSPKNESSQRYENGTHLRSYEKKVAQLRIQDANSAELFAIERTRAAIRDIWTKFNISLASVNAGDRLYKRLAVLYDMMNAAIACF
uniref:Uncharacterized protein n=1 Tax=Aegilops tauschii TaxID=37682 RepID=M8B4Q0_AEGTA